MSIQPAEAPVISLELLVGEMPEVPCGHADHESDSGAHKGQATHYGRGCCSGCGYTGDVTPLCWKFIAYAMSHLLSCPKCGHVDRGVKTVRILGPVRS